MTIQSAPQITFRNMDSSAAIEAKILERVEQLEHFYDDLISCHVVVEMPHAHHHKGKLFCVRVDLKVPGQEIVASRMPAQNHAHEDVYVAIRDAFNAVERQLEDYARRRRNQVKTHDEMPRGRVARLFPGDGFGFIEAADGTEVYFHKNSVLNSGFEHLEVGAEVHFVSESGEKGPQASTVRLAGKPH